MATPTWRSGVKQDELATPVNRDYLGEGEHILELSDYYWKDGSGEKGFLGPIFHFTVLSSSNHKEGEMRTRMVSLSVPDKVQKRYRLGEIEQILKALSETARGYEYKDMSSMDILEDEDKSRKAFEGCKVACTGRPSTKTATNGSHFVNFTWEGVEEQD